MDNQVIKNSIKFAILTDAIILSLLLFGNSTIQTIIISLLCISSFIIITSLLVIFYNKDGVIITNKIISKSYLIYFVITKLSYILILNHLEHYYVSYFLIFGYCFELYSINNKIEVVPEE